MAEVGCGCYNKDDQVAKALLEALGDCDPDVKKAAIEAISQNAAACNKCSNGCEATCCTEDIYKKLEEMATGLDDKGCPKEPDREIRAAAAAALRRCGCPPVKPLEEVPAPPEIEEVPTAPEFVPPEGSGDKFVPPEGTEQRVPPVTGASATFRIPSETASGVTKVSFSSKSADAQPTSATSSHSKVVSLPADSSNEVFGNGTEPVRLAHRKSKDGSFISGISNSDQLVRAEVSHVNPTKRGLDIVMPDTYDLKLEQHLILVDQAGNIQVGTIQQIDGKRVRVAFDQTSALKTAHGEGVRVGLMN